MNSPNCDILNYYIAIIVLRIINILRFTFIIIFRLHYKKYVAFRLMIYMEIP